MEIYNKDKLKKIFNGVGFELLDQNQPSESEKSYSPSKHFHHALLEKIRKYSDLKGATFTFSSKYHKDDPEELYDFVKLCINKSNLWKNQNFILYPEYTKNGNLHFHSLNWDIYETPFIKMIKWWRRTFGFVKIELKIRFPDEYILYQSKNYGKIKLKPIISFKKLPLK